MSSCFSGFLSLLNARRLLRSARYRWHLWIPQGGFSGGAVFFFSCTSVKVTFHLFLVMDSRFKIELLLFSEHCNYRCMMHVSGSGFWTRGPVESPSAHNIFGYMATRIADDPNTSASTSMRGENSHKGQAIIFIFKHTSSTLFLLFILVLLHNSYTTQNMRK